MSIEKNMNTRIQHKHDIEANWNKALNFIPKIGEIIIYDIDDNYNYSRFKIGDGVRTINNIEFSETDLTGYATEKYVDNAIPNWAKAPNKPSYTKSEVGLGNVDNVKQYSASNPPVVVQSSAPSDTSVIWIDPNDNTVNESFNQNNKTNFVNYLNSIHCPIQLPANEESKSDFNLHTFADFGSGFHSYFDDLVARYPHYLVREHLGKDSSNTLDMYRYILGKHYWSAWYKENYPRMYAWKNNDTIIYSTSVSPRIGDNMYVAPVIGEKYGNQAGTENETISIPGKAVIIRGYRYSHSGQSWSTLETIAALVFPAPTFTKDSSGNWDTHVLTLGNAKRHATYTGCYVGTTTEAFPGQSTTTWETGHTKATFQVGGPGYAVGSYRVIFLARDNSETFENTTVAIDGVPLDVIVTDSLDDISLVAHATTEKVETEAAPAKITAISATNRSRTINNLEFIRYEDGDVEPTLYYTAAYNPYKHLVDIDENWENGGFTIDGNVLTGYDAKPLRYIRYPFGDLTKDKKPLIHMTIIGNEHGGATEPAIPSVVMARLIRDLCNGQHSSDNPIYRFLRDKVQITFIPSVNPHGLNKFASGDYSGYRNANNININRNYDTPGWDYCYNNQDLDGNAYLGPYPGSENETQYVMNTMVDSKAKVAMSVHTISCDARSQRIKCMYQGQNPNGAFTQGKIEEIADDMKSSYNLDFIAYNPLECPPSTTAKSPSFITQIGAYGGIVEMQCHNPLATEEEATEQTTMFTDVVMEQNYSLLLKFITMWLSDYLEGT